MWYTENNRLEGSSMHTSLITKKRIAKAFALLLEKKEFDKISVSNIMELSGIRRQTFYNYFLDIFDLIEWILKTDLQEQVTDNLEYISGLQLVKELFYFFDYNKNLYKQIFNISGQNDIQSFFLDYCRQVVEKIIKEYGLETAPELKTESVILYHSHALAETFKDIIFNSTDITELDARTYVILISQQNTRK